MAHRKSCNLITSRMRPNSQLQSLGHICMRFLFFSSLIPFFVCAEPMRCIKTGFLNGTLFTWSCSICFYAIQIQLNSSIHSRKCIWIQCQSVINGKGFKIHFYYAKSGKKTVVERNQNDLLNIHTHIIWVLLTGELESSQAIINSLNKSH